MNWNFNAAGTPVAVMEKLTAHGSGLSNEADWAAFNEVVQRLVPLISLNHGPNVCVEVAVNDVANDLERTCEIKVHVFHHQP